MKRTVSGVVALAVVACIPAAWAAKGEPGHSHAATDAIGVPGKASEATRTVKVDMTDAMRFVPASVDVRQGETVRFVITNSGKLKHEFVLGTAKDLKEHYELMKKFPEMEHDEPSMATVAPGKTGEVVWRFTKARTVDIGCLQPGHYDAGMKAVVRVGRGAETAEMTTAEVRKVDLETKKITLRHAEIKSLGMPQMTMVFQVSDAALLEKVKAGSKVRFTAERLNGVYTVTSIELAN